MAYERALNFDSARTRLVHDSDTGEAVLSLWSIAAFRITSSQMKAIWDKDRELTGVTKRLSLGYGTPAPITITYDPTSYDAWLHVHGVPIFALLPSQIKTLWDMDRARSM